MNAPHVRIVIPEEYKGTKHVARHARMFITLPGFEEVEMTSIRSVKSRWTVDDATIVTVEMLASVEVHYE